jgi:hypothetical protein
MLIVISLDALLKKYTEKLTSETERWFSREIRAVPEIRVEPLQNWNRNCRWVGGRKRKMRGFLCAVLTDWKFEFN